MAIRVLTISKPYVATAYRDKLERLAKSGRFEIGLICPPAWGHQKLEPFENDKLWTRVVPIVLNGHNHFHMYRGLHQAIRSFRPQILNVEEEHYSAVTWQAFRIAKKVQARPIFYTWQNIHKKYPAPFSWIEDYVFRHAAAAVAGNHEAAEILRAKGFSGHLHEIPQMGVDLERFAPPSSEPDLRRERRNALGLSEEHFWVAYFGRLVEEKGVQHLLEAFSMLPADSKARLLVVGSGPYEDSLKSHSQRLAVETRTQFVPFVKSTEVPRYLQAVEALCLPSLTRSNWKEQFGRILVEAMAAEAVPIGSNSGEIPLVIGDSGLVFPEGDPVALSNAILGLEQNPERLAELRSKGSRRVRKLFSNDVIAGKFAELFEQVVNTSPHPSGITSLTPNAQL